MTTTVLKTILTVADEQTIAVPRGAMMLHAATKDGAMCVWYRCDPKAPISNRRIRIAGTGHPIADEAWEYIGSCFLNDGALVFHIFELPT